MGITSLSQDLHGNILASSNTHAMLGSGVFRSEDSAYSWEVIYSESEVDIISVDHYGGLYLGLESDLAQDWGIRYSKDDGDTWTDISSGMQECIYINQIFASLDNYIYAISYPPYMLYKSANPSVSVSENENISFRISPNPFCYETVIAFDCVIPIQTYICIYSTDGQIIKNIQTQRIVRGQRLSINLANYPPGYYLVRIYNERYSSSFKLLKF